MKVLKYSHNLTFKSIYHGTLQKRRTWWTVNHNISYPLLKLETFGTEVLQLRRMSLTRYSLAIFIGRGVSVMHKDSVMHSTIYR